MDKNYPTQNLKDKRPLDKSPRQKPPRTSEREFVQGAFVWFFVLGLLKIGGQGPRCVTYFLGVPGCVTKCDRGEGGSKLAKNNMTYFMDGPIFKVMFNFLFQQKKSSNTRC